ncbi:MAG: hypothetical protein M5U19_18095 [Microthrixaceae bacterium]|nr:hypothetical protein [Microthrixaceae bacterium]
MARTPSTILNDPCAPVAKAVTEPGQPSFPAVRATRPWATRRSTVCPSETWSQMPPVDERLPDDAFSALVDAEIEGRASEEQIAALFAEARRWRRALYDRLDEADDGVERAKRIKGPERAQVLRDFESIGDEVDAALDRLDIREGRELPEPDDPTAGAEPVEARLQASWSPSQVVVWFAGSEEALGDKAGLSKVLSEFGAPSDVWSDHDPVVLPDDRKAAALAAPIEDVIGWLLGHADDDRLGASARWLGQLGLFGVGLVARGSMVPLLRHRHRTEGTGTFAVRWHPVLVDERTVATFAKAAPATVFMANPRLDALSATRSALVAAVNAVCVQAASRIEAPAPPPRLTSATDLAEAYLGRLDGSSFRAGGSRSGARAVHGRVGTTRGGTSVAPCGDTARPARGRPCVAPAGARSRSRRRADADRQGDRVAPGPDTPGPTGGRPDAPNGSYPS